MFSFEQSISEWRKQMLAAGIQSPTPLDELEIHLREEIERQRNSELSEQEIFDSAVQKIGPALTIKNEFAKVNKEKGALNWKLFEMLFLIYSFWYPLLVASLAFFFKNGSFSDMTFSQQISSLASAIVFSLFAWMIQLTCGKFPAVRTNRIRDAIFIPVMLWLVIFAYLIMPHASLDESQRAMVSLWGLAPFGIVLGWIWGFATAARKKVAAVDS
jgi:hypothetical protein